MTLTTQQVSEKLGLHTSTIGRLVRLGKLQTVNKPEPGKRVAHRFDSKAVQEFKAAISNGEVYLKRQSKRPNGPAESVGGPGQIRHGLADMSERLKRLEESVRALIALWS